MMPSLGTENGLFMSIGSPMKVSLYEDRHSHIRKDTCVIAGVARLASKTFNKGSKWLLAVLNQVLFSYELNRLRAVIGEKEVTNISRCPT